MTEVRAVGGESIVPRVGGTALSQQVFHAMIQAIRMGSFEAGRLPAEVELADLLGVSRTTVRRVLQSLEQIGLIERRPGRGTRVRRHARPDLLALHGLVPFPTLLRELGHVVTTEVTWRERDTADPDLSLRLGRTIERSSYARSVILRADGIPAVAMDERFPGDVLAPEVTERDLSSGSILFVSQQCFKDKINHAIVAIEPQAAVGPGSGEPLGLEKGAPYLVLDETFYSSQEIPLAISRVSLNAEYVSFSVFRRFL